MSCQKQPWKWYKYRSPIINNTSQIIGDVVKKKSSRNPGGSEVLLTEQYTL